MSKPTMADDVASVAQLDAWDPVTGGASAHAAAGAKPAAPRHAAVAAPTDGAAHNRRRGGAPSSWRQGGGGGGGSVANSLAEDQASFFAPGGASVVSSVTPRRTVARSPAPRVPALALQSYMDPRVERGARGSRGGSAGGPGVSNAATASGSPAGSVSARRAGESVSRNGLVGAGSAVMGSSGSLSARRHRGGGGAVLAPQRSGATINSHRMGQGRSSGTVGRRAMGHGLSQQSFGSAFGTKVATPSTKLRVPDERPVPRYSAASATASRQRAGDSVLVPELRSKHELSEVEQGALRAQRKLEAAMTRSTVASEPTRQQILKLFNKMDRGEFNTLSKESFVSGVVSRFPEVSAVEAAALFEHVDADGSKDVTMGEFTQLFKGVDSIQYESPRGRRTRKLPEAPYAALPDALREEIVRVQQEAGPAEPSTVSVTSSHSAASSAVAYHRPKRFRNIRDVFPAEPVTYADLPAHKQPEFRDRTQVAKVLEKHEPSLTRAFLVEAADPQGGIARRTRLTHDEVATVLQSVGVELSAERVRELYPARRAGGTLTFSELAHKTNEYFHSLEDVKSSKNGATYAYEPTMELNGRELGCRRGAGKHTDISPRQLDTLAPRVTGKPPRSPRAAAAGITTGDHTTPSGYADPASTSGVPAPSFVRWSDKTVDAPKNVRTARRHFDPAATGAAAATVRSTNPITWS